MHGLQFSDKVKQLPRLTPIWAHGAVLAGVRLSESGNPTVLAPGVKCGECLKCVECKWKESGAAGGGSARRELVAIRLIGGGVVIDPGISPLPGADHPPEQDAPAVCSSRRSRCRHPLVCDRRTIASSTRLSYSRLSEARSPRQMAGSRPNDQRRMETSLTFIIADSTINR